MDLTRFRQETEVIRHSSRTRLGKVALTLLIAALLTIFLLFITLPVVSLFLRISPEAFFRSLSEPVILDALSLSLTTATVSTVIVVVFGTPLALVNARYNYRGRNIVDTLTDLPIVLPPAVAGIALLMAFGRRGVVGQYLDLFGIHIAFTTVAVVLAQVFVASPFYVRQAKASFEAVDRLYEDAARTLGASPLTVAFRITIPLAWGGLISGAILSFARALGEFGATIMFAGNYQGRTQTMPLAIYTTMQGDLDAAISLAIILVMISFVVIAAVKIVTRRKF
ncbi:MAG TPA: ABC transporter permease [Candidatus Methanoculleus thermohydrogenotrophicum]|jgi:molybdate transport system permease protein|nr:ABC transporter permease [Candidatus Methanoculleus thermohydrogenotrophicum]NLM82683.1 molybdate ABC transporter permease subunit [Candidatus Methanoculleus thermohydrogenotrophicum]HOB17705.1 ABC transporter permease [Candidatus Methanoculleus thermohydrogenotrophicum]HPZ37938.1 ABC transporter permease [Candidatus Methanoculleus thermohydrogenotrophicum]HQC91121.1 ABC transporter permease [Candidatus Methanoculleus thermohydrogenotrophicum]